MDIDNNTDVKKFANKVKLSKLRTRRLKRIESGRKKAEEKFTPEEKIEFIVKCSEVKLEGS